MSTPFGDLEPEAIGTGVVPLQPSLERLCVLEQAWGRLGLGIWFLGAHGGERSEGLRTTQMKIGLAG
jgi:hypothetical protein